ncbi:MAG: hypothetical protein PVG49_21565 [Desulfobacteraceae bacterium]|jgi:hypothetical protein
MNEEIKRDLRKLARDTETRVAQSLLKWKYRKEGKPVPDEQSVRRDSEAVAERANRILAERGKRAWAGMKRAYRQSRGGEDGND